MSVVTQVNRESLRARAQLGTTLCPERKSGIAGVVQSIRRHSKSDSVHYRVNVDNKSEFYHSSSHEDCTKVHKTRLLTDSYQTIPCVNLPSPRTNTAWSSKKQASALSLQLSSSRIRGLEKFSLSLASVSVQNFALHFVIALYLALALLLAIAVMIRSS